MGAPTTERYPATVTSNDDPDQLGRVRVNCAGLAGDEEGELPMWVEPALDWGWFLIPDVGEIIEVEVNTGSEQDESFQQASIDNLDIKWRGVRFYGNEDADEPTPINEAFTTNYGKRRGFATPAGHYFIFDDKEDDTKIIVNWVQKKDAGEEEISQIVMSKDSIKVSYLKKHTIELKDNELEIKLGDGASLKLTDKDGDATTVLGDGGVKAAIADHLKTFYNTLKGKLDTFDNHTHPTAMGTSGPPNPTIGADSWDDSIESSKLTFPDG